MNIGSELPMKLNSRQKLLLLTLAIMTFTMGTSEFVIVGLLSNISADLGITITKAGTLVSIFAIGMAIGGPILTVFTGRYSKRSAMLVMFVVFLIANLICAISYSYSLLIVARVVMAVVEGVLFSFAMVVGSESMPDARKGTAISLIFGGFSAAQVLGVPIGTFIGQLFGWRATFWGVTIMGIVTLILIIANIPKLKNTAPTSLLSQIGLLANYRFIVAFLMPIFCYAGIYVVYTYISPIFIKLLEIPESYVSLILLGYGLVALIGNTIAGKIANRNAIGRLRYVFIIQSIILVSLMVTGQFGAWGLISIGLMALSLFLPTSSILIYLIETAKKYNPAASELAASLFASSVNIGFALGAVVGGIVISNHGLINTSWVGGIIVLGAALMAVISFRMDHRNVVKR
jgi:DHA1 family inner membrane transport protein